MNKEPPQILRVKRKRTDDPLQALVMETSRRRIKRPKYIFRLQRTEQNDIKDQTTVLSTISGVQNNCPVYNIPSKDGKNVNYEVGKLIDKFSPFDLKRQSNDSTKIQSELQKAQFEDNEQPVELNPQLLEMLNDYLKDNDETVVNNSVKLPKRRQSSVSQSALSDGAFNRSTLLNSNSNDNGNDNDNAIVNDDNDYEDYVYDVYYRDKAVSKRWETENIGYIKFDDDDLEDFENDNDLTMISDDEDSNDENFYRNDYPEDEDSGYDDDSPDFLSDMESMGINEPSDDQDDEFVILNDKRRFSKTDFLRSEGVQSLNVEDFRGIRNQIDETYGDNEDDLDDDDEFGNQIDDAIDEAMDDNSSYTESFTRNEFFSTDRDDPIAIHRDRIFGKLQNMLDDDDLN